MTLEFVKQSDQPLFPEIFWNRPTMRSRGGRLLIIGGQKNEFSLVQAVYQMAEAAGVGEATAAMPDSLRRLIGETGFARFVPASQSGSLGRAGMGELMHLAEDVDALIIGANLTNNSETGIMIESLIRELDTKIVITEEAIKILKFNPDLITGNPNVLVIATMPGIFELANNHHMPITIRPNGGLIGKLEILEQLISISKCGYVVFDKEIIVASEGDVSVTELKEPLSDFPAAVIGVAATFWIQHPSKPFAALTTAAFILSQACLQPPLAVNSIATTIRKTLSSFDQ